MLNFFYSERGQAHRLTPTLIIVPLFINYEFAISAPSPWVIFSSVS